MSFVDQEVNLTAEDSQMIKQHTYKISEIIQYYVEIYIKSDPDNPELMYLFECKVSNAYICHFKVVINKFGLMVCSIIEEHCV